MSRKLFERSTPKESKDIRAGDSQRKPKWLIWAATAIVLVVGASLNSYGSWLTEMFFGTPMAPDAIVTVKAESLNGWAYNNSGTGAGVTFELGPGTAPAGNGSARFTVGPDPGVPFSMIRTNAFAGVLLSDITSLSYATYGQSGGGGTQAPVISLLIDNDNNGTTDERLYFEPVYQNGTYGGVSVPNQCGANPNCVTYGQWQSWNALIGGFWEFSGPGGPPLVTLASYATAHPGARIGIGSHGRCSGRYDHRLPRNLCIAEHAQPQQGKYNRQRYKRAGKPEAYRSSGKCDRERNAHYSVGRYDQ